MVKFCNGGDKLEITITTSETVTWNFGDGDLPTGNAETSDATKTVMTLPTLTAAHTGVYKATYDPNKVEKFTIIVGAKTCTAVTPCIVKPGGSIHLDSGEPTGVTWYFKAPSGSETEIKDSGTDDPPKFTDTDKKELGLFNLQKAESGTYTAKKPSKAAKDFPVAVRAPVTEAKVQKRQSGCNVILECNVDGDAKSFKWTNGGTVVADATQKQLTIQKVDAGANADYVCKATDYDNGEKTSATFAYTYAA
ncbi:uncharacterized protein LOC119129707 [Syngnathus acus]|uniref:uncharacterized protein LOC119129707 n=1 Tax=Syngnathus acus TaxID=161584 RepID=UPI0018862872|nr:uncharacterized protein LOC119129707 [Syngnathus acus]